MLGPLMLQYTFLQGMQQRQNDQCGFSRYGWRKLFQLNAFSKCPPPDVGRRIWEEVQPEKATIPTRVTELGIVNCTKDLQP